MTLIKDKRVTITVSGTPRIPAGTHGTIMRVSGGNVLVAFDNAESLLCNESILAPVAYGWGWIDGEDEEEGNQWIQISELDDEDCLDDEELAVLMLRNAVESERKFPGITAERERNANLIVNALNYYNQR